VAEKVALIHNISLAQVAKQTTENAKNLFGL
jgi:Tat protein secretion system quality control protein TatD with DNase activity